MEIKRYIDRAGAYGYFPVWDQILFDLDAADRRTMLGLIADLRDPARPGELVVHEGMGDVLEAMFYSDTALHGALGHLEVARDLLREFPGARMRFEISKLTEAGRRDVDIVIELESGARTVEVEVKNYAETTSLSSSRLRRQIRKDLLNHQATRWSDLLWRFVDQSFASRLPEVQQLFLTELESLGAAGELTESLDTSRQVLLNRFRAAPPWTLIDVLH